MTENDLYGPPIRFRVHDAPSMARSSSQTRHPCSATGPSTALFKTQQSSEFLLQYTTSKRGVRVAESAGRLMSDGNVKIPMLEDGQQYKFLGVFESLRQDLRANRIDAKIVNHQEKKVIAMEMSRPWVSNRQKKTSEKTMKYAPLRWELKQKYPGYEISQYSIIVDILGGWLTDVEVAVKELVGRRHRDVLKKMQRACLSVTLNIARTFEVATH